MTDEDQSDEYDPAKLPDEIEAKPPFYADGDFAETYAAGLPEWIQSGTSGTLRDPVIMGECPGCKENWVPGAIVVSATGGGENYDRFVVCTNCEAATSLEHFQEQRSNRGASMISTPAVFTSVTLQECPYCETSHVEATAHDRNSRARGNFYVCSECDRHIDEQELVDARTSL